MLPNYSTFSITSLLTISQSCAVLDICLASMLSVLNLAKQ